MRNKRYFPMEINGKNFTLDSRHNNVICEKYFTLYDAYKNPSNEKQLIWANWNSWFIENNGHCWVCSYNAQFFSIEGYVLDEKTDKYYGVHITAYRRICWEIS